VFGLMCLWTGRRHPGLLRDPGVMLLAGAGAAAWLTLAFTAMDYWEPKLNASIFAALLLAATAAEHSRA